MDKPSAIEWGKSERERQILYINAYIWNIEWWYWWIYLQGSSGDIDNRLLKLGKKVGWFERVALKHRDYHMKNR